MTWIPKNRALNCLLGIAIVTVLAIEFWLNEIPELFAGGHHFGPILRQLGLSYVASYIFFAVVVHLKSARERRLMLPFIRSKSQQAALGAQEIALFMARHTGVGGDERFPSKAAFASMGKHIKTTDPGPSVYAQPIFGATTWWDFFVHWKNVTTGAIDDLLVHSQFLEAEHIRLLVDIRECDHNQLIGLFTRAKVSSDCAALADGLFRYSQATKRLVDFIATRLPDEK